MSATTVSLNSTNFEDVPIVVSTAKKSIGYNENFQIELDAPIDRIQATFVESIQFPGTGYIFNTGNNLLVNTGSVAVIKSGTYTGDELAEELTNRVSQVPGSSVFSYEWSYDNFANKFIFSGGNTLMFTQGRSILTSGIPGSLRGSTIAPLISFLDNITIPDPNNPGEFIANSDYEAYESFTVISPTNIFSLTNPNGFNFFSPVTTANITGFALATELQTAINAQPNNSGFVVTYNTNNFKLFLRHDAVFRIFGWPVEFGGPLVPGILESNQYEFNELHGVAPTHTITTGVNDIFTINENNGNTDITLPEVTNATLPELAILLQTAFDEANLVNSYEITFSSRTARFRIKALQPVNSSTFPLWSLVINTASGIFGYTIAVNLQTIIKSDTPQFELFPSLTGQISMRSSFAISLPFGSPDPTTAASLLESNMSATTGNIFTVTYDNTSTYAYTITNVGGVGTYEILSNGIGAPPAYGFPTQFYSIFPSSISSETTLTYGPTYLYIKSNALSEKKITTTSADPFYKNVVGKIILDKTPIQVIFNNFSISTVNKLAVKTAAQTIDFRLEDEDGVLYYSNGADWAFTIVFERF